MNERTQNDGLPELRPQKGPEQTTRSLIELLESSRTIEKNHPKDSDFHKRVARFKEESGVLNEGVASGRISLRVAEHTRAVLMADIDLDRETDEVTGLYTRGALEKRLREEMALAQRTKIPLSVAMLDIDGFKEINDENSHFHGDAVLRILGNHLLSVARETDIVARYGGEEMIIVYLNTDEAHAKKKLIEALDAMPMAIREALEGMGLPIAQSVTTSIGVAQAEFGTDNTKEELDQAIETVKRKADSRMYLGKQNGKNRVVGREEEQVLKTQQNET